MRRIAFLMMVALLALAARSETVTLYNDNGQGGIHNTTAEVVVDEGQYFVDFPVTDYGGRTRMEHLKVYRVIDSPRLFYNQDHWAEPYLYVVERPKGIYATTPYYFNMQSRWRPSLTEDPNDPYRVVPIQKIIGYHDDGNGGRTPMKVVLVETQGKYMLYYGDDFFAATIENNTRQPGYAPAWSRSFKYRATISGFTVYFNIN